MGTCIDIGSIRHLFDYDTEGYLVHKNPQSNRAKVGGRVYLRSRGSGGGYSTRVSGVTYQVHRLIYAWHHGFVPEMIDHINGDRSDNRIENLRACTTSQNNRNHKVRKDNTSGYSGVQWFQREGKWKANISINGRRKTLGTFSDKQEAIAVRLQAEKDYYGHFARQST